MIHINIMIFSHVLTKYCQHQIKLIPLYAERNIDFKTATNIDVMEIKNIKGILSAA